MKTRTLLFLLALACLVGLPLPPALRADAPVVVATTAYGPMDGFDLYGYGIYWWNAGFPGSEVTPSRLGQIAVGNVLDGKFISLRSSGTYYAAQSTALSLSINSVARTDDRMFFYVTEAGGQRIHARSIYGTTADDTGNDFSGVAFNQVGAMTIWSGDVFWSCAGGAAADAGEIRAKSVNGGPGGGDTVEFVGTGVAKKMQVVYIVDDDGNLDEVSLLVLNTAGQFWRCILQPIQEGPFLIAYNVTDFAVRQESYVSFDGTFFGTTHYQTVAYTTTGTDLSDGRLPGHLVTFSLDNNSSFDFYQTGDPNLQLTGVAVDDQRIFLTRTPVLPGGGLFANRLDLPNSQILRQAYRAHRGLIILPSSLDTIAIQQEGRNLRSDGQWLYYADNSQVKKIKTDAPPIQLDYRAVGVEAVQAVQDFNNSVPLVSGKPTLVRGYAQLAANTTGLKGFPLNARLRAFSGPTKLYPDVYSENAALVDGAADLPTLRANLNRSFLFTMPMPWLAQAGLLRLEMTVNPSGSAPETGPTPLANNTTVAYVTVAPGRRPCLVFKAMSSTYPNYDMFAPNSGFPDIIDRALTLMPVADFNTRFSPGSVTKPVVTFFGIKQRSFSLPDDATWALIWMTMAHAFSSDPGGCADTHWVGMFPPEDAPWNGIAGARGVRLSDLIDGLPIDFPLPETPLDNTAVVRMSGGQGNANNQWGSVVGGHTLAHEVSHNYGRFHIDQTRSPSGCPGQSPKRPWHIFPGDPCTLGITDLNNAAAPIGYDPRTGTLVLPNMAGDLMTYANSDWISPFTWNALIDAVAASGGAPAAPLAAGAHIGPRDDLNPQPLPPHDPIFMVQGVIQPDAGAVTLLPAFALPMGTLDPAKVKASLDAAAALPVNSPYKLRLIGDPNAAPLDERPVVPLASGDGNNSALAFVQAVPQLAGATRIQILNGETLMAEITGSPNAPLLTLNVPNIDAAAQSLTLDWVASDADGDTLLFTVQFSSDNGVSWQTLRMNDPTPSLAVSTSYLAGGDMCRLRVMATDGFNTTIATTDPFALAKHAPVTTISGLYDQQLIPYSSNLVARAFSYDAEDGSIDPATLTWAAAGPETRTGSGGSFSLARLAPGNYALSVTAVDADGNPGVASLSFTILPLVVPDGPEPALDGLCADAGYTSATEVRFRPDLPEPTARFVHANGYLYACFNGLPLSDDGATPSSVELFINPNGALDSTPQPGDYGFGVDENGVPFQSRGDGAAFQVNTPIGFSAQIMTSLTTWGAELRIPENLIGGWNHNAAAMLTFARWQCVTIFGICIPIPEPPVVWPATANASQPATWAPFSFGPLAPVPNRAPVAVASGPGVVSLTEPQTLALNGSASYDLDGDPLTFTWTQVDGPAVTLQGADTATPSFTTPDLAASATLTFQLVVNDGQADSVAAPVSVTLVPASTGPSPSKVGVSINVVDGSATIQLCWPGTPGDLVVIQASTDLMNWENIATNTVSYLGVALYTDLTAGIYPQRFYRAASSPVTRQPAAGSALQLDGVAGRVEVAPDPALNSFPLTITAWIKSGEIAARVDGLISRYVDASLNGFSLFVYNGNLRAWYFADGADYVWDGGLGLDGGFVANDQWHHVAFVMDADGGRLYVDGYLNASLPWTGTPGAPTTTTLLQFGRYDTYPTAFLGQLDEVTVWQRALTETEIRSFMHHPLAGTETDLLGCWHLDEGSGATAADATGHGYDGTLQDGAGWIDSTAPLFLQP